MNSAMQARTETAETRLRQQLPPPSKLCELLYENRRERVLLRRLLTLSECIYSPEDTSAEAP